MNQKMICRSKRNAADRILKLKELIERWDKGVSMLNSNQVAVKNAAARFNKIANEIAELVHGYENIPEIEFLLNRWNNLDHENTLDAQRLLLTEYYEKWDSLESKLEKSGDYDMTWREGFDAAILRKEDKETS